MDKHYAATCRQSPSASACAEHPFRPLRICCRIVGGERMVAGVKLAERASPADYAYRDMAKEVRTLCAKVVTSERKRPLLTSRFQCTMPQQQAARCSSAPAQLLALMTSLTQRRCGPNIYVTCPLFACMIPAWRREPCRPQHTRPSLSKSERWHSCVSSWCAEQQHVVSVQALVVLRTASLRPRPPWSLLLRGGSLAPVPRSLPPSCSSSATSTVMRW